MMLSRKATLLVVGLLLTSCTGSATDILGGGKDGTPGENGGENPGGPVDPNDERLAGPDGRQTIITWDPLEVPLSSNVKMLSFAMMKSEVQRATGLSWTVAGADQWERNAATFGGADYVTGFVEDITPSQQKIVLWRKMAYQVCLDAVNRDAGKPQRVLFTDVDPGAAITAGAPAVATQVKSLYQRFFLEAPSEQDAASATKLVEAAYADGNDAKEAWRALCVGFIGSMKFLTY